MSWRDTQAYIQHNWLLNEAKEVINAELKAKVEAGEIEASYGRKDDWLNVIHLCNYEMLRSVDVCTQYARDMVILMRIHNLSSETCRTALTYICSYINATNSVYLWNRDGYRFNLRYCLWKYFGIKKPLNYDTLRYVLNYDLIGNENEEVVIVS